MAIEDLPPIGETAASGAPAATEAPAVPGAPASAAGGAALTPEQLNLVADTVRREVKPLRQVISAYTEKNDLQSILGGLGYIIGLFGIGYYVAARQKLKKN